MRAPIAILLLAVAQVASVAAPDPNWLQNPGFELEAGGGPAAWALGMEGRGVGEAVWQRGGAHTGEYCLRVMLRGPGDYYMGRQHLPQAVESGALYQIAGWYRASAEMVAHPCVYNEAADGHMISAWEAPLPRAQDWTPFRYSWRPPPGTVRLQVQLRAQGVPGTAWFDDVLVGPATALEAQQRAQGANVRARFREGQLALRALRPSERPTLTDLAQPERWDDLLAADRVRLFAARGEGESFGAVVLGLGEGQLTARMSELQGPQGSIPSSCATVRSAQWVMARGALVPDPLLDQQPFTAPEGGFPMLWVTLTVPREGIAPGVYIGNLAVQVGSRSATLPVSLRVHGFALPRTTYLQSSFWSFRYTLRNAYGMSEVPFDFYARFLDVCLRSRLAPIDAAEWQDQPLARIVRDRRGQLQVDWTAWDQYLQHGFDRGMGTFNVGLSHWMGPFFESLQVRDLRSGKTETLSLQPGSKEYAAAVVRFFSLCREHFGAKGWAGRAYLQGYDEPANDPALLAQIKRFYGLARQGWPGLRTLITCPVSPELDGSIGIWCPLTPHYDEAVAGHARARGEEVWWYVCCGPTAPWANLFLTQSGAAHRVLLWQTFGRRSDGLLYWGINHWPQFAARTMPPLPASQRWPAVPWDDGGRDGDGYLLYPGPDGPVTSLRLEIMRDGVEDYDALRMLEALVREKVATAPPALLARARWALEMTPDLYASMTSYPGDAGAMVRRRLEVNQLIERLQSL